jgi:hypothetical protein
MDWSGYYYMDGKDLWTAYNVVVEAGSDDFLKYAAKKESITHDWMDSNGLDVDLSRYFLQSRSITLKCAIITNTPAEFWNKYHGFIADFTQPGSRRITVAEFGERSFNVHYKDCSLFERFTRLKDGETIKVACKFTINLIEIDPSLENDLIYIVDEDGRFIVT